MGKLIEFRDVVKKFNGVPVLDGVTFGVEKGEVLCVVGPSGTGKSVTLKHLVRLLTPTSGQVLVDGVDVAACSDSELVKVRDRIGYLFQGGALLAWMTVAENVALPLEECTKLGDREIAVRVRRALRAVELVPAADKYPAEISGGMQKRAGLARAIVRESDIVLYDEPTSGLDPVSTKEVKTLVKALAKKGMTVLTTSHLLADSQDICDRVMILNRGKSVAEGKVAELGESLEEFFLAKVGSGDDFALADFLA